MQRYIRLATAALILVSTACSDTSTAPVSPALTPASIIIADPGVVRDGDVVAVRAEVRSTDNRLIPDAPVQWASTDPTVAVFSSTGQLIALREGMVEVVASVGPLQTRRTINVVLHPAVSLTLSATAIELPIGTRGGVTPDLRGLNGRRLLNRPITFQSSNEAIARVTDAMEIVPVSQGTATITARYGTLTATVQVRVLPSSPVTTYGVQSINNQTLPFDLSEEVTRDDGVMRVLHISRLESGTVLLSDRYEVRLSVVHYERVEYMGAVSERVMSRQTVRDFGSVSYNWLSQSALLQSEYVGGLLHTLNADAVGPWINFREPGTNGYWRLGLSLR